MATKLKYLARRGVLIGVLRGPVELAIGSTCTGTEVPRYRFNWDFQVTGNTSSCSELGPRTHRHAFGPVPISPAKELPQRATAGHSTQQPYGRPENGHRSVTYQQFVGPASVVMKSGQKGSWDLYRYLRVLIGSYY